MELMNIWQLQRYVQTHPEYERSHFLYIGERGVAEFKWLDAWFGFMLARKSDGSWADGFISVDQLVELLGADAKYHMVVTGEEDETV